MTSHREPLKSEVGVLELDDRLSRYVQHVKDGGEVVERCAAVASRAWFPSTKTTAWRICVPAA